MRRVFRFGLLGRSLAGIVVCLPAIAPGVSIGIARGQESAGKPAKIYSQPSIAAPIQGAPQGAVDSAGAALRDKALKEGGRPLWIWGDNGNTRYVIRKSFEVSGKTQGWLAAS
ncbi:MAG: hypothetical protein ACKO8U_19775, partial [Pirellula sp.]